MKKKNTTKKRKIFFFFFFFFFKFLEFVLLHERTKDKKRKKKKSLHLLQGGGAFFKRRRDFETRFSFSFLSRRKHRGGKKKINSRQKNHHLQKRTNARFERTQTHAHAHKTREREREKDDDAFFFSDINTLAVVCLFILCSYFARTTERKREDVLVSRL